MVFLFFLLTGKLLLVVLHNSFHSQRSSFSLFPKPQKLRAVLTILEEIGLTLIVKLCEILLLERFGIIKSVPIWSSKCSSIHNNLFTLTFILLNFQSPLWAPNVICQTAESGIQWGSCCMNIYN
jgi:hypothetical protein